MIRSLTAAVLALSLMLLGNVTGCAFHVADRPGHERELGEQAFELGFVRRGVHAVFHQTVTIDLLLQFVLLRDERLQLRVSARHLARS